MRMDRGRPWKGRRWTLLVLAAFYGTALHAQQFSDSAQLPDAPQPAFAMYADRGAGETFSDGAGDAQRPQQSQIKPGFPPVIPPPRTRAPVPLGSREGIPTQVVACVPNACTPAESWVSCQPDLDLFGRFLDSSPHPLTPQQKLLLASRNVIDPFNLLTIVGDAGITIASNPDTHYGPGLRGFAKYAGTSFTTNMVGEFLGTFLIPSVAHLDPRYHRMPNLSIRRRLWHAVDQVVWTQSDTGNGEFNYASVFGTIGTDALGNVYIPGRKQGVGASASRVSIALATAPIGNFVTEFLPDVARLVNIRVVIVQRIINRAALMQGAPPG